MTVPTDFFGGNSDGAMRMEDWLHEMCSGCRYSRTEDWGGGARVRGLGCELPARAYTNPHDDLPQWEVEVDEEFGEHFLTCTAKRKRTRGPKRPPTVGAQHPQLDLEDVRGAARGDDGSEREEALTSAGMPTAAVNDIPGRGVDTAATRTNQRKEHR